MDSLEVKPILESILFVSPSPVKLETLVEILPESDKEGILEGIQKIKTEYEDPMKGLELVEVAGGYQFRTKPQWAEWVNRLKRAKTVKFSQPALETLAIVAYRQPIIRPQVEQIRGVDSGWVLHSLLEKGLLRIVGRKDLPGRPLVYATTKAFLELFNLNSLSDLPTLKEIQPPPSPGTEMKADAGGEAEEKGEVKVQVEAEDRTGDRAEEEIEVEAEAEGGSGDQEEEKVEAQTEHGTRDRAEAEAKAKAERETTTGTVDE